MYVKSSAAAVVALLLVVEMAMGGSMSNTKFSSAANGMGSYTVTATGTTTLAANETSGTLTMSFKDSNGKAYNFNLKWNPPLAGQSTDFTFTGALIPAGAYDVRITWNYVDANMATKTANYINSGETIP